MKKSHIIMLLLVAAGIASLTYFLKDLTISTTFTIAKQQHKNKFVHIVAELDKSYPIYWNPKKDPNYMSFYAKDSIGGSTKVVYKNNMPTDFTKSAQLVLKGYMRDDFFECKEMQLKCPSKFKDMESAGMQHPDSVKRYEATIVSDLDSSKKYY